MLRGNPRQNRPTGRGGIGVRGWTPAFAGVTKSDLSGVAPPDRPKTAPSLPQIVTPDLIRGPAPAPSADARGPIPFPTAAAGAEGQRWTPDQVRGDDVYLSSSCLDTADCRSDFFTRSFAGVTNGAWAPWPGYNRHPGLEPHPSPRTERSGDPGSSPGSRDSLGGSAFLLTAVAISRVMDGPRIKSGVTKRARTGGGRGDGSGSLAAPARFGCRRPSA